MPTSSSLRSTDLFLLRIHVTTTNGVTIETITNTTTARMIPPTTAAVKAFCTCSVMAIQDNEH